MLDYDVPQQSSCCARADSGAWQVAVKHEREVSREIYITRFQTGIPPPAVEFPPIHPDRRNKKDSNRGRCKACPVSILYAILHVPSMVNKQHGKVNVILALSAT